MIAEIRSGANGGWMHARDQQTAQEKLRKIEYELQNNNESDDLLDERDKSIAQGTSGSASLRFGKQKPKLQSVNHDDNERNEGDAKDYEI